MKKTGMLLVAAVFVLSDSLDAVEQFPLEPTGPFKVKQVLDGDTLDLEDGRIVRMIGVDCVDFHTPDQNERRAGYLGISQPHYYDHATKAKDFVEGAVKGRQIQLAMDPELDPNLNQDNMGRIQAYVYADGKFLNAELLRRGLCHMPVLEKTRFLYRDSFNALEAGARNRGAGMWRHMDRSTAGISYPERWPQDQLWQVDSY